MSFMKKFSVKKSKGLMTNKKKNVFLTKKQFFETIKLFNILIYNEKDIHFKNFYLKMSKNVLLNKHKNAKFKFYFNFSKIFIKI